MKEFSELQQRYTGFNRTFMELKYVQPYIPLVGGKF